MQKIFIGCCFFWILFGGEKVSWSDTKNSELASLRIQLPELQKPSPKLHQIDEQVKEWFKAWRQGRSVVAKRMLKEIYDLQHSLGIPNIFYFATALVKEGDLLRVKKDSEQAYLFYVWANKLAPDLSLPVYI